MEEFQKELQKRLKRKINAIVLINVVDDVLIVKIMSLGLWWTVKFERVTKLVADISLDQLERNIVDAFKQEVMKTFFR